MKRYDYENGKRIQLHATEIDASEFDRLFDAWEGGRKAPHGIWYIDEGECWTGIDNYDGDFFVEPFGLLADCIKRRRRPVIVHILQRVVDLFRWMPDKLVDSLARG